MLIHLFRINHTYIPLSSIFLGTTVIPRRNWKQWFSKILGCVMGYMKIVNVGLGEGWWAVCQNYILIHFVFSLPTYSSANPTFCAK